MSSSQPTTDKRATGKALRACVSRSSHTTQPFKAAPRPDPITLLEKSNEGRLANLVPIRYARMLQSPFTFLRGAAVVMASDLSTTPTTGIKVQSCGDCHLLNFGGYATPERNLIFDLNDFDETLPGAWEWDVKRLATSCVVAGRHIHMKANNCFEAAHAVVKSYREHMNQYAEMSALEVWYSRIDADILREFAKHPKHKQRVEKYVEKAFTRTSAHALPKFTEMINHQWRIVDNPPLMYHLAPNDLLEEEIASVFQQYRTYETR